jgi:hypothetical protein
VPQIVALQGDTRQAVEDQRGENDPHEVRKSDEEIAAEAAAEKQKTDEKEAAKAAKAAADKAKADKEAATK